MMTRFLPDRFRFICASQRAQRILCIEDDRETAALLEEELLERGFAVRVAYGGKEGLAAIEQETPDLILCDICMPDISGFEVLQRLTTLGAPFENISFAFLTALTDQDVEFKGRRLGAEDYVTKPIDFDTLHVVITAQLATRGCAQVGANIAAVSNPNAEPRILPIRSALNSV
jgi:DNA-binding response OmpR family regulator